MSKPALRVCVTGAAGQIGYSLVFQVAEGNVFGADQPVILHMLDVEVCEKVMNGVAMELQDCALPLLQDIVTTTDPLVAFKDVDAVFLVGSVPHRAGQPRRELLAANAAIFKVQGEALDKVAKKTVRVVVVANPANSIALICAKYAPSIPRQNFSAMTRLDQNRAQAQITSRLKVPVSAVYNCISWGNHSSTQYPDVTHALAEVGGQTVSVPTAVADQQYLRGEFVETIRERVYKVMEARGRGSAMSAAKAACDQMHDWFAGTAPGRHTSMGVVSDGSYATAEGIFFSFPVTVDAQRNWKIVQGLTLDETARAELQKTGEELCQEREEANAACEA